MLRTNLSRSLRQIALAVALTSAAAATASAGTITTWTGTGANGSWTTSGNWSTALTTGTYSLVFSGTSAYATGTNNIGGTSATVTVDSISFSNNGLAGQNKAYTLARANQRTLTLTNGGTIATTLISSTANALTETINSTLNLSGTGLFDIGNNHNLTIGTPAISSISGGSIVKTGAGELFLNGSFSLPAGNNLSIRNGSFRVSSNSFSGLSNQLITISTGSTSGSLSVGNVTGTTSAQFSLAGDSSINSFSGSNLTFSSGTFNSASASGSDVVLSFVGGSAGNRGTNAISGVIQDNLSSKKVSVAVTGFNTWVLNGVNTYTGTTSVASTASLLNNGSIAGGDVSSSGLLAGTGTFGGAVTILSGTLAPGGTSISGSFTDSIGKLTVGSLTLAGPATTAMTVSGSTIGLFDQIAVTGGALNYGGVLALTLSGSYADHTTFSLFSGFGSTSGHLASISLAAGSPYQGLTFSGTADASGDWYTGWTADKQQLKFSESTGVLTVVPEPSTIVFAGIGLAMCGWSTWTRRRSRARRQAIEAALA